MNAMEGLLTPVDVVVRHFDVHVDRCQLCLVQGNYLCYEGRAMIEDAAQLRSRAQRSRRPIFQGFPGARRRPAFPAAAA
jgi:hypothetical protein